MNRLFRKTPHYNTPFSNNCALLLRLPHSRLHALISHSARKRTLAQRGICADLSLSANPPTGIARRAGRSPSAARKLPQRQPRSPRGMTKYGKPLRARPWNGKRRQAQRGASGGMQGGPRRGRSPITGPALPHAAQAAKTTEKRKPPCPQDTEAISQRTSPFLFSSVYMSQIWIWLLYRSCSIA